MEFRPPDATCNVYLALSAQLLAGLDGIQKKIDPTQAGFGPIDANIFAWSDDERAEDQEPARFTQCSPDCPGAGPRFPACRGCVQRADDQSVGGFQAQRGILPGAQSTPPVRDEPVF